jgi:hypothetical protein
MVSAEDSTSTILLSFSISSFLLSLFLHGLSNPFHLHLKSSPQFSSRLSFGTLHHNHFLPPHSSKTRHARIAHAWIFPSLSLLFLHSLDLFFSSCNSWKGLHHGFELVIQFFNLGARVFLVSARSLRFFFFLCTSVFFGTAGRCQLSFFTGQASIGLRKAFMFGGEILDFIFELRDLGSQCGQIGCQSFLFFFHLSHLAL